MAANSPCQPAVLDGLGSAPKYLRHFRIGLGPLRWVLLGQRRKKSFRVLDARVVFW